MIKKFFQVVLCAALALPAYAGQGTIVETDTQIIIEYSGGDDDVKAAKAQEAERDRQRQAEQAEIAKKEAENKVQEQKLEKATRKGDKRKAAYGEVAP